MGKTQKFSLNSEALATEAVNQLNPQDFHVGCIEKKEVKRHPAPPFITSTLNKRLREITLWGLSPRSWPNVCQALELRANSGAITYMRTDSVTVSGDFITHAYVYREEHGDVYKPQPQKGKASKMPRSP